MAQQQENSESKVVEEQKSVEECSTKEIKNCPSAQAIKELLITLQRHSDQSQKLQSEIVSVLEQQQYTKPYIQTAINDAKKRLKWNIESPANDSYRSSMHCQVYSRSDQQWTVGVISGVSTEEKTEREWLTVKYGDSKKKTKDIQRFCSDLKPIGIDDEEYIPNEEVMEYIAQRFKAAENEENDTFTPIITGILEKQYDVVQLLDHIHHLKYDHEVDRKDEKFDEIFDFFKESMTGNECDVNDCDYVRRHYRNRGGPEIKGQGMEYSLLMDTVSMIHCYFVHSFDIDRFSKADRAKMAQQKGDQKWAIQTDILVEKKKKLKYDKKDRRARYQGDDDEEKPVDFESMARMVGEDNSTLKLALRHYQYDRERFIRDLIDVVFAENEKIEVNTRIWSKLKVDDERKREIFRLALCGHFNSNQFSAGNMVKLSQTIIARKGLKIDIVAQKKVMNSNKIDGRIFDETDTKRYKEKGDFTKLFEAIPDCDAQHVGELYGALKDWLFIFYVAMDGLRELKQFEEPVIDFFLQNPMDIESLSNLPESEFADRMVKHWVSKQDEEATPLVDVVEVVIQQLKGTKKAEIWQKYGEQIIGFFRENAHIDGYALESMSRKDLGTQLMARCDGNKKIKGRAGQLQKKCVLKMKEKSNPVRELSVKLLQLMKERMVKVVDFVSMAQTVGVEAAVLSGPLNVYKRHPDRLIDDLIDVICNEAVEHCEKILIWNKFKMENHKKRAIFRTVLCRHFKCTDLNATNFIKMSEYIIRRKGLKIDRDALNKVVINRELDGRIFDEMDEKRFRGKGVFAKDFSGHSESECDGQHLGELYTAVKKWNVAEIFMESVCREALDEMIADKASKSKAPRARRFGNQIIDFIRSDIDYNALSAMQSEEFGERLMKYCGSEDVVDIAKKLRDSILTKIKSVSAKIHEQPDKVYEIGKRFVFWQSEVLYTFCAF